MKNYLRFLLLLPVLGLSCIGFGQLREPVNPTVTVIPTITHATCYSDLGVIDYEVQVTSEWENDASVNSIQLVREGDSDPTFESSDPSLTGTINNVGVGQYTLSGSVSALNNQGMGVSIPFSITIWLGIQTIWTEKIDMITSPNSYSAKRNTTSATYGGVRSSNRITSGDGWIELSAVYGTTTDNRVFLVVGETSPLGVFNPAAAGLQHIEFYKGSGGNGIRVRYLNAGNIWVGGISSDPNDRVRLVRTGTTLSIQLNDSPTNVFTFPEPYSGPMNIAVRTLAVDDGCLDVVSSFPCTSDIYAKVERQLRGVKYSPEGDFFKFYVTEEYDNQSGSLDYKVFSDSDRVNPVLSGSQQAESVVYGDNRYSLDVGSLASGSYILEVKNEKKEKFYLRFIQP